MFNGLTLQNPFAQAPTLKNVVEEKGKILFQKFSTNISAIAVWTANLVAYVFLQTLTLIAIPLRLLEDTIWIPRFLELHTKILLNDITGYKRILQKGYAPKTYLEKARFALYFSVDKVYHFATRIIELVAAVIFSTLTLPLALTKKTRPIFLTFAKKFFPPTKTPKKEEPFFKRIMWMIDYHVSDKRLWFKSLAIGLFHATQNPWLFNPMGQVVSLICAVSAIEFSSDSYYYLRNHLEVTTSIGTIFTISFLVSKLARQIL